MEEDKLLIIFLMLQLDAAHAMDQELRAACGALEPAGIPVQNVVAEVMFENWNDHNQGTSENERALK